MGKERSASIARLYELNEEIRILRDSIAVLGWDQECYMPAGSIEGRSRQLAYLSGLAHDKAANPEIGKLLTDLGASEDSPSGDPDLSSREAAYVRASYREHSRETRVPTELVMDLARATSAGQAAWAKAREQNDFGSFAPHLENILGLSKKMGALFASAEKPYDGLIDLNEPGMTEADIESVFIPLGEGVAKLVDKIAGARQIRIPFEGRRFPKDAQDKFGRTLMSDLGFDSDHGRLDVTAHPFTTSLGSCDVRITTRYFEDLPLSSIFSTIHETGHALYEQGFLDEYKGDILAAGSSTGIHESQSRFWENTVGRSREFWSHYLPKLKSAFPEQLGDIDLEGFYRAVNKVEPAAIRVEADEVSYSLHVIMRFKIESALFDGSLGVRDIPATWNSLMKEALGVLVKDDAEGCLQDIHWSMGAFGYFPSYALGNIFAAQFTHSMRKELPTMDHDISEGCFSPILAWLRKNIHNHGAAKTPTELVRDICGGEMDSRFFLSYLNDKYEGIYGL